ncbi:hypothetical protein CIPAW_09G010500 [Carya illinoinensis]|uniref:60S acidic ribosomal protein P2 n=1 Tax=Carya illinoinensis TaxID=32201 RepID=A0A8T1PFS4_CARIL|nr:hypothetical protein CIPAW_09G010500 [Carya illinoinensis]
MKVIAAYLLALLGGNTNPSAEDIKNILGSVKGKDITKLIATGREKLAFMSSAHGFVVATTATNGGAVAAAAAEPKQDQLEKVEEKEESDEDMCFSIFD